MENLAPVIKQIVPLIVSDPDLSSFWKALMSRPDLELSLRFTESLSDSTWLQALTLLQSLENRQQNNGFGSIRSFFPKYQLIRSLVEGAFPQDTILPAFNIDIKILDLGLELACIHYLSSQRIHFLLLSQQLKGWQQETLAQREITRICAEQPVELGFTGMGVLDQLEEETDEFVDRIFDLYF